MAKRSIVTIPLTHAWPFSLQAQAYNEKPRFVVFGGLVFQPVDANFMSEHNPDDLRLHFYFDNFISRHIYREREEIVVLSNVLADPVNAYASEFRYEIVDKINGQQDSAHRRRRRGIQETCRLLRDRYGRKRPSACP